MYIYTTYILSWLNTEEHFVKKKKKIMKYRIQKKIDFT